MSTIKRKLEKIAADMNKVNAPGSSVCKALMISVLDQLDDIVTRLDRIEKADGERLATRAFLVDGPPNGAMMHGDKVTAATLIDTQRALFEKGHY